MRPPVRWLFLPKDRRSYSTLRFSVLSGASAMIETVPLEEAPAAYAKMMSGEARFRMVLTMEP